MIFGLRNKHGVYAKEKLFASKTENQFFSPFLSESLDESIAELRRLEERFVCQLAAQTALELERMMKTVQDTPRLYRRTNRDVNEKKPNEKNEKKRKKRNKKRKK